METAFTTPPRCPPRTAMYPWTSTPPCVSSPVSASAASMATPIAHYSSSQAHDGAMTAPVLARMRTPGTPTSLTSSQIATNTTATPTPDRFIADRTVQDAGISHFLLTTRETLVPIANVSAEIGGARNEDDLGANSSTHNNNSDGSSSSNGSSHNFGGGGGVVLFPPMERLTAAPYPRDREAWGGRYPFGAPAAAAASVHDSDDDHDDITHHNHSRVASPLVVPPLSAADEPGSPAPRDVHGSPFATVSRAGSAVPDSHQRSTSRTVQGLFASWQDGSSRTGSVAGITASPLVRDGSAWPSPLPAGSGMRRGGGGGVGRRELIGGGRSPSASFPRGTAATPDSRHASAPRSTTTAALATPGLTPMRGTDTPSSASFASTLVEAEPYTCKLARTLFTDAAHTSVLGFQKCPAQADRENSTHDVAAATPPAMPAPAPSPHPLGASMAGTTREASRFSTSLGVVYEHNRAANFQTQAFRVIPQTPERILDAADMVDDFYLNLVDWSAKNVLCVALQSAVYMWEAASCNITQLPLTRDKHDPTSLVCGVQWTPDGRHLSLGFNDGSVEVWDAETQQVVQTWRDHALRVGALSWAGGDTSVLATGSKDATIRLRDLRDRHAVGTLRCHQQEVCGLRWSPNSFHLASGGNDNQVLVWDRRWISSEHQPRDAHTRGNGGGGGGATAAAAAASPFRVNGWSSSSSSTTTAAPRAAPVLYLNAHTAAVKALAWNPVQTSLLASGGGTDDRTLRFWNTLTGECVHSLDTGSQVCGVLWAPSGMELVSSHGFSMNQLSVWKYPSLRKLADLTGHTSRVLHLCLCADGEVVVSAAGDETIRFWRCFPPAATSSASLANAGSSHSSSSLSGAAAGHARRRPSMSEALSGSPIRKQTGASPYGEYYHYGSSSDGAATPNVAGSGTGAATARSPWSGYDSPLSGAHMEAFSSPSGGLDARAASHMFVADEVALR